MVRIHPDPPVPAKAGKLEAAAAPSRPGIGAVAQLGERLLCKQEAVGSIPSGSTRAEGSDLCSLSPVTWHGQGLG